MQVEKQQSGQWESYLKTKGNSVYFFVKLNPDSTPPQHCITKTFRHTANWKEFYSERLYTHRLDSAVTVLRYFITHLFIPLAILFIHLIFDALQTKL